MKPVQKELKQEHWWKIGKGSMLALKGNKENVISGQQMDSVQSEALVVSSTMRMCVEKQHSRPLLLQDRRHKIRHPPECQHCKTQSE